MAVESLQLDPCSSQQNRRILLSIPTIYRETPYTESHFNGVHRLVMPLVSIGNILVSLHIIEYTFHYYEFNIPLSFCRHKFPISDIL